MSGLVIQSDLSLVTQVARQVRQRLPRRVELNELVSDGYFGLRRAMERFDRSRGVPFRAFARPFIRGAILDGLRNRDWLTRRWRIRPDAPAIVSLKFEPPCESERIDHLDRRESFQAAAIRLPRRQRLVLHLYYVEEMSMKQIGRCLGITESRVSQIRSQTIQDLRDCIDEAA